MPSIHSIKLLHRWLGLSLGVFLAISGLTGSWLIYDRAIAKPAIEIIPLSKTMPLETLYQTAIQHLPVNTDIQLRLPKEDKLPYQFRAKDKQMLINQYTGEVLIIRSIDYWPHGWLLHLHAELLQGKPGKQIIGWFGVGIFIITLFGLYLGWPRRWSKVFKLRLRQQRFVFHYDLHKLSGLLVAPLFMLVLITGISLSFSSVTNDVLSYLFNKQSPKLPLVKLTSNGSRALLDDIISNANAALPGGRIGTIQIPNSLDKPVAVRKRLPSEPHPNGLNMIYINPSDASVLQVVTLDYAEPSKRWFNWAYPLHSGEALPYLQWVLLVVGLVPTFLLFTSLYMYLIRSKFIKN
ncbi:MAG: PepSY-associated TM helix domain-containing protein [Methylotenera sp.]|uniref:PepSY-associated TM helix domain-containing protein n=1 Tax=Methylotenera sp. TaxID=2051956 RepID=UPI0024891044|nr:PepSY-associated TM helix domain-containing protein [Methylotenera sp.]MDI1308870.1 PepSY-associated TM helix domain-containing protein [Methylotenera sp.]